MLCIPTLATYLWCWMQVLKQEGMPLATAALREALLKKYSIDGADKEDLKTKLNSGKGFGIPANGWNTFCCEPQQLLGQLMNETHRGCVLILATELSRSGTRCDSPTAF